jgi:hypothetical protein
MEFNAEEKNKRGFGDRLQRKRNGGDGVTVMSYYILLEFRPWEIVFSPSCSVDTPKFACSFC